MLKLLYIFAFLLIAYLAVGRTEGTLKTNGHWRGMVLAHLGPVAVGAASFRHNRLYFKLAVG